MRRIAFLGVCCLLLLEPFAPAGRAQATTPLGKISFPNSGSPAAQADFIRGAGSL